MHADQLNVTCFPARSFLDDLEAFLVATSAEPTSLGSGKVMWRYPSCTVKNSIHVVRRSMHHLVSFSGGSLGHLRTVGAWFDEVFSILASVPHTVSKLEIAHDVPVDGADSIQRLRALVPGESSKLLSRKALPVEWFLAQRDRDSRYTGTMYIGRGTTARLKLKVYDKAFERRVNAGILLLPTTRYELTFMKDYKGGGVSLRDAYEPERLFWDGMPAELLPPPGGVSPWRAADGVGWNAGPKVVRLPTEVLSRRVDDSAEIDALLRLADQMGPNGRIWLARRILGRMGVKATGSLENASHGLDEASGGR